MLSTRIKLTRKPVPLISISSNRFIQILLAQFLVEKWEPGNLGNVGNLLGTNWIGLKVTMFTKARGGWLGG